MIQFRWKHKPELVGKLYTETGDQSVAIIDGKPCVLEYRQLFIPQQNEVIVDDNLNSDAVITLAEARPVDKRWVEVTIK